MFAVTLVALALTAGDSTPPARDTLILAHEFTAATEFVRLELDSGQVYRVEVTDGETVQVRALLSGVDVRIQKKLDRQYLAGLVAVLLLGGLRLALLFRRPRPEALL